MKLVKYILLTIIGTFINIYTYAATKYGDPQPIKFAVPLQAGSETFDMVGAKAIANALFYIAVAIGGINVVRTMVFNPDRSKKVIINWCVGIIVFAVVINIIG